jgi:hypothetical protein
VVGLVALPDIAADASAYPFLVAVMVTVEDAPAASPEIVTELPDMATDPPFVAVPEYA